MAKKIKQKQTDMKKVQLFVDTNMDITPEYADAIGVKLLKITAFVNDELVTAYEDNMDLNEYYLKMRNPLNKYHTAAIPPAGYFSAFEESFKKNKDILYLHFSGECSSAAMNNICLAEKELKMHYPKRKLYLVDTKQVCAGGRLIVDQVVDLINQGKTLEEILSWCDEQIDHFALSFAVDDIKFMQRSGRVSKAGAVVGTLLNIKPISRMKDDGHIEVYEKVKGNRVAAKKMLQYSLNNSTKDLIDKYGIVICDSGNAAMASFLEIIFKEEYGDNLKVVRTRINPIIGVHSGPGAFGVAFYANHR